MFRTFKCVCGGGIQDIIQRLIAAMCRRMSCWYSKNDKLHGNAAAVGHWCQYASMAVNSRLRTSIVLIPNQIIKLTRQHWNKGTWITNCFRIIPQQVKCSTLTIRLLTSVSFHLAWHFQTVSICCQISLVLDLLARARPQSWRRSLALATVIYDERYKTQLKTRIRK